MPNHVMNELRIEGTERDLAAFRRRAMGYSPWGDAKQSRGHDHCVDLVVPAQRVDTLSRDRLKVRNSFDGEAGLEPLSLHRFLPVPAAILDSSEDVAEAYDRIGHAWGSRNWGSPWGCYAVSVTRRPGRLTYVFKTAWAPPSIKVLTAMSRRFPMLKFRLTYYEEPAAGGAAEEVRVERGRVCGTPDGPTNVRPGVPRSTIQKQRGDKA